MPAVESDVPLLWPSLTKAHLLGFNTCTHWEVLSTVEDIHGGKAETLISDVSDFDAVSKTISAFGSSRQSIDILFLNAGISVDRKRPKSSNPAN